jgi:hypothetical protein
VNIFASRTLLWPLGLMVCLFGCKREPERLQKMSVAQQQANACTTGLRCLGPKAAAACVHGIETQVPCRGPDGCAQAGTKASCDDVLARTGDACAEEHDFACALDRKAALECQSGVFRVVDAYTGIQGCSLKGDEIACDKSVPASCDDIEDIACCLSFARRPKAK